MATAKTTNVYAQIMHDGKTARVSDVYAQIMHDGKTARVSNVYVVMMVQEIDRTQQQPFVFVT